MKRLILLALLLTMTGDARLFSQRQGGPAPPGRQGGAGAGGRQGAGPARDRAPREGTAIIRGRVLAADSGTPLRRAEVQAAVAGAPPRFALSDADGRFELRGLPAGSLTVTASKTGFVAQQFGQRSPFSAGEPVSIAEGQQLAIDFGLMRGGVITGRVFDDLGDPVANVRVSALRPTFTATGRRLVNAGGRGSGLTDDTGAYRLYGLAPGTYYVSATAQSNRPVTSGETVAYAATYFPGTIETGSAERVAIDAGQEQHNIDFALTAQRTFPISGTVVNSNGQPVQANVSLSSGLSDEIAGSERRARTSPDGRFTMPNVAPGNYVLEVSRTASGDVPPEVAAVPISVNGGDMTNLVVTTGRGASVIGTLATDNGSRIEMTGIRVSASPVRNTSASTPRAQATNTGMFELAGLIGARTFRFEQLPSGWIVKSVSANGVDVTDAFLEFRGIEEVSLRVVLTSRVTQLTGMVLSNRSTRGAGIVLFPDDRSKWTPTSRYVRTARADEKGQFTLRGLPGNERYLAVALDYLETGEQLDPDFLNRLRPLATSVTLAEGEQKQFDLALHPRP